MVSETIPLRGGHTTSDPRLDRIPEFDERSRNFPVRALLATKEPRSYTWACDYWLDQRAEGACTGFSTTHEAGARPVVVQGLNETIAREVYHRARQLDPWEGEDYEGSSVLASIKAGVERGWFSEYRWAFGVDDLTLAVGYRGPAVLGVNWYSGMFRTDTNGFIHVRGEIVGGHAILCMAVKIIRNGDRSVNDDKSYFVLHNSWGQDWGVNGRAKISINDMRRLLAERGEACIPVRRLQPAA